MLEHLTSTVTISGFPHGLVERLPLLVATPPGWAEQAVARFDEFLLDHAACERKAAANGMAIITRHAAHTALVDPLVALAREELEHFAQVWRLIARRGLTPVPDAKDPYVNGLRQGMRSDERHVLADRLLISALIEARSCERLFLIGQALHDPELAAFYNTLARSEAGHFKVFVRLAERCCPDSDVPGALARLAEHEAKVMLGTPWRPAVH